MPPAKVLANARLILCNSSTNLIFTEVYSIMHRLENLVYLDIGVHLIFDHGTQTLWPSIIENIPLKSQVPILESTN